MCYQTIPWGRVMLHMRLWDCFTIFLCFPACLQVLLFSHSLWYGPSLSLSLHAIGRVAWVLVSRAIFCGTLGKLWLNTDAPLPLRSLVSHLWLFSPFLSLMGGLVSMTHKVIQTLILTDLAVFQCGFIGSSPGNAFFFFWEGEMRQVPRFLPLHNFSL